MALFTAPQIMDGPRWRNMRVGILGGSFNPPHAGHIHISDIALKRLGLDCVWWLVTPQNPLKDHSQTESFDRRFAQCQAFTTHHPRIIISDIEQRFGSTRTVETIFNLRLLFPDTRFVFLAGTDILPQFHLWYRWRDIPAQIAMAFIARPPASDLARQSVFDQNQFRTAHRKARLEPGDLYKILDVPLNTLSSTEIRKSL